MPDLKSAAMMLRMARTVMFRCGEIELDAGIDRPVVLAQVVRLMDEVERIVRETEQG